MSRIPESVVAEVVERAAGRCEACGLPLTDAAAFHHRKLRSQGGRDEAANLMLVHGGITGGCHNLHQNSIHQNPERSRRLGHIVRRNDDPARIPVRLFADLAAEVTA